MKDPVFLLVDDSKDNLYLLKELIIHHIGNYLQFTADSAEKGLEIAREKQPDIILSDVQMPGMNGVEFCQALKASPETGNSIVLLLTGYVTQPEFIAEALNVGAFDFIAKPVNKLELIARINAALRKKEEEIKLKHAYEQLEAEIEERTSELKATNHKLQLEIKKKQTVETMLRQQTDQIMTIMEGTDEGVWDLDLTTGITSYDKNWLKVIGHDGTKVTFDSDWWLENVHQDSLPIVRQAMKDYLAGKEKYYEVEYRIKTNKGDWIWVWARGVCIAFDENGKPLRMVGTQRNITEKMKAEEAYQRLAKAIEQVEDIIVITDQKADIQFVNPSFERVTGYAKEAVIGRNPRILKSGVHDQEFYQSMWQTLTSGEVWSGRMINRRKNGAIYNEEATITPIKNKQGDISNYIAVKRDVTHQVQLEQQLQQAQKMEAIGTLAGGIAHDFNNILFAIQGYNSLSLRLLDMNHPSYAHLQKLGQAAERAKNLVSQILTFSRQSEHKLKPILLQPVVKEVMNMLRATIPTTIDVRRKISSEGGLIMGDLTHVHQIVVNLATNAYQAMRETGGTLTVSLDSVLIHPSSEDKTQGMNPGRYAVLKVMDTGSGMDPEIRERIFEPYFSTKEQGEGTGLGLSIIHGIVTSYNGQIIVESHKGVGTTFQVLIPEIDSTPDQEEKEQINEDDLRGTEKILVVDDESQISDMIKQMLEELGYSVDAYSSSEQVLEEFRLDPHRYDLIITDMTMPKLTGSDLAEKMLGIKPSIPIILCTGYSEAFDEEAAKAMGIKEYIMKPVSIDDLAKAVKRVLTDSVVS